VLPEAMFEENAGIDCRCRQVAGRHDIKLPCFRRLSGSLPSSAAWAEGTGQVAAVPERSSEANGRRPRGHREIAHDFVPLEPLELGSGLPGTMDAVCLEAPPALPKGCVGVIFTK